MSNTGTRGGKVSRRKSPSASAATAVPAHGDDTAARFRHLDRYRVVREWERYDGTGQRRLFQELRNRFLDRHTAAGGWVLDLGSGPGRFLPHIGRPGSRRVAIDLSVEMLRQVARGGRHPPELVRGDGVRPSFRPGSFQEVVVLGNALGFAGANADRLRRAATDLVAPGGNLILEFVAGAGERSRYLSRLPPTSLARLLRAPLAALLPRIEREGFTPDPPRRSESGDFRRYDPSELESSIESEGGRVSEIMAVAPALGPDRERVAEIAIDPEAWAHLLDLEERIGRQEARLRNAAAVLVAVELPAARTV